VSRILKLTPRIPNIGDATVLNAAREQIRTQFREHAGLDAATPETQKALQHAADVARFLRTNLVQARREEGGDVWKLRIHDEIERGDNDTIKVAGQTVRVDGKTCADR